VAKAGEVSKELRETLGKIVNKFTTSGTNKQQKRRISEKLRGKNNGETWGTFWRSVEQIGDLQVLDNG